MDCIQNHIQTDMLQRLEACLCEQHLEAQRKWFISAWPPFSKWHALLDVDPLPSPS